MDKAKNIAEIFAAGQAELKISLDDNAQEKLLRLLVFLKKWNQQFNLTAITDISKMVTHHLLDSLSIAPYIQGDNILDFGSGAGFPGVPLAVYYPQKQWCLLDSNGKKTRFLTQLKAELDLPNVEVVQARIENWNTPSRFTEIVCRAVGPVKEIVAMTHHFLQPKGRWLLMKGEHEHESLADLPYPFTVHKLQVPGVLSARYLIEVSDTH